jgi:CheY-like chemotaxis protein
MKTLLVVEANEVTREGLALVLRREGYAVEALPNGRQPLDYLRSQPAPDLILLAMFTPSLDGWGFLQEYQRLLLRPPVPVLIIAPPAITREWATEHGCAGLVSEPIDTGELLAEVRRCLGD